MAAISATFLLFYFTVASVCVTSTFSATVVEDLANLQPPSDFNNTIMTNCLNNPHLRYCNSSSPMDLTEIFRSTIVASHLCNESRNPNCVESFPKIDLRAHPKIAPLYLSYNFFWKYCPLTIMSIDLSNISLKGGFPTDVLLCTQIQALDLSRNDLTGDVPIESFTALTNLTFLNLSYNRFSESKCETSNSQFFFKRFNASSFLHSGLLHNHQNYTIKAIFLLVGFPISVILMVGCFGWLCFRRPDYLPRMLQQKHKFTPSMLGAATNGFSRKRVIAKGEGVDIYRGRLRDGTLVRIEIYRDNHSKENSIKFVAECKILAQLRHRNLVQVLGWCSNRHVKAIVTEWSDGESINAWLSASAPSWKQRLKVLKGIADAVWYLQEKWPEVGYDLRASSILLSDDLDPVISRFTVADQNRNNQRIYKFGVFLLEMITNGQLLEEFERGEAGFIQYIRASNPESLHCVVDMRMHLTESMLDQVKHGIDLGLLCTDQSTTKHPSLKQISHMIRRVYQSCPVLESHNHGRCHGDGDEQSHVQP
ncbi:hypothetical protein Tsubulata_049288 [Turnera subulata]|uniref:Protein kinase domain-containing protein n=1 Tax=Turnera subulata TaxID=218843 RepID=A0A9Q0JPQ4_9ROSI|nr:hypothetical protein Tsubulata_049288 [Turnera subulata]